MLARPGRRPYIFDLAGLMAIRISPANAGAGCTCGARCLAALAGFPLVSLCARLAWFHVREWGNDRFDDGSLGAVGAVTAGWVLILVLGVAEA